jgi:serpin B
MINAFCDRRRNDCSAADFSGMDGTHDLFISGVLHKAFIEVNEEGTEAAAATATVMVLAGMLNSPPVEEFRADHPFIFLIRDRRTESILFVGRMTNPEA